MNDSMFVWRSILMSREFAFPFAIFILIGLSFFWFSQELLKIAVLGGMSILAVESWQRIREQKWNLDYIAFLRQHFLENGYQEPC